MPNDAPAWEDTQELTAEAPTWDATTDLPPAPLRPQRVRAGINETVSAVMRPLDILTSPAAGAASEMGRAVAERQRQAQMRVVAPGALFPSLVGPEAAPTPEDQAVGQQLVRGITSIPGRVLAAGARTVRDVLSPTTYLPEEMKPAPPFVISTRGDQPAELRQMTRAEEAARDPLQGDRGLIPVRGTQLDPEGSQGAQLLSGLSSLDNIGIIATGGASKLAGMALLFSMAPGIYEDVKRIASSETPLEEKQKAINNLIIPLILGAKGAYEGRPVVQRPEISGPPVLGSMLRTPGGFTFEGRAAEPVGPVPTPKVFRPEVPGTPAEPRLSIEEEIRAKGARTKEQIRKLFPDLSREQAAAARDRAWGKQPETPAKAPKFEETTPEPPTPPAAPPAPVEPTPPAPPAAPAAPAAPPPEPTPAPPELAAVDHTDIEQANKLSATELMQALKAKGKGTTAGAYDLGEQLTPESRAKARQYEQAADKEAMDSLARAKAEPDRAKGLEILQKESFPAQQKKQFFNEAGRFYDAVQDVKSGKPLEQAAIDHGVDENVLRRVAEAAPAEAAGTIEPKPGYTRVYHGEGGPMGAGTGGDQFTEDVGYAANFGRVFYVDVPNDVLVKARAAVRATGTGGKHFILPDEYVKQAKEMATQPGAKVFDVTEEPAAAEPPTPGTIEATPIAGKTLADWEQATDLKGLPKRAMDRAELATYLAVPNQPSRILAALKNKKRTREIHAPPPTAPPALAPEAAPLGRVITKRSKFDFQKDKSIEAKLWGAAHGMENADLRWAKLRGTGATDEQILKQLGYEFGEQSGSSSYGGFATKGGTKPRLWTEGMTWQGKPTLEGRALAAKAREVLEIPKPLSISEPSPEAAKMDKPSQLTPEDKAKTPEAPEKIVAAAYQPRPGITETGANHPEILKRLGVTGFESPESRNTPQFGFQTDKRGFITREEAGPVAEKSGQNLKEFEPGEPVHSNEVASPTQPEKPLSEAGPEEPPKVPFEGYAPGTPEAKDLRARAEAADTKVSDLYTALSDAEEQLKNSKYGTKKQEQLERKVEKLRKQYFDASQETKDLRRAARLDRLRELAETGAPAQRWAASAEYARKIAEAADEALAKLRDEGGRGGSGDTFYWQVVDRARRFGALAKEISDKGYALFNEKVSKQLQELGATKEEADFEAMQIVNMQFSYPGMKSVEEAPLRMRTIEGNRLREETSKKAEALKAEFGVLHDTGFERRAREVSDKEAADRLLKEQREEYQRRKDEVDRKEKAKEEATKTAQANELTEAKSIPADKLRWYWDADAKVWRATEGKTVKVETDPAHEYFVHKAPRGGGFAVTESSTGLRVGNGKSHKEAIANANERLTGIDPGVVTRAKKIEELIRKQIPETPRPTLGEPAGPEQLAGPGSPAAGQGPDPVVTGLSAGSPGFNSIARKLRNFYTGIGQLFKRGADKQTLAQLTNAADNIPRIEGQRAGNTIRNRTDAKEQNAITFIMQALKMSGEGISVEATERLGELEFLGDPKGYLETKATDMETKAQEFLHNGQKLEAQAAIDAARHMRYAKNNFGRLRQYAELARKKFDAQYQREQDANIAGDYENWHVPQRHDLDLMTSSDRPIILGHSKGTGTATGFRKAKVFEDYATAIENGFVPRSFNIADLLEHRVNQGERLIQRKALFDRMKSMADPVDGRPLAQSIPKRRITRPDGTIDTQESVPRGYQSFEVLPGYRIAVHDGYAPMMRALTGTSQISESAVVGTLQDIAGVNKHLALALDTFHASRIMQAELALTGKLSVGARQRIGRALVEYDPRDLGAAVRKGEITQEMADYITTPQPLQVGGRTINVSPAGLVKLGIQNGLNAGRFSDALYRDWIRELPITGSVNKWVFDKLSRSAITHGFLAEFERVARNSPELNATQVARKVASDINVLFGNLQKESIFRNPSVKAVNQILFLAPNWVEALARREIRAVRQFAELPAQLARGEAPRLGTVGRGIGHGLAAYFVGTQVLNLITRHQLTFQNPEPGHKLDAWIPDVGGKTKGFFISPLSVFGEIAHDILRYSREKADVASALTQIGANKMGNMGRMVEVLATGRDPASGEKLLGTSRRAIAAGMQMVPVPISLSQGLRAAGAAAAPGLITPPAPGAMQRQLLSSAGLKTEPAGTAQRQIYALADKWKSQSGSAKIRAEVERRLKEDFGPSDYKDIRLALLRNDLSGARRAFDQLRKTKEPQVINRAMRHPHPFTGSAQAERAFVRSLSDEDKKLYREALEERKLLYSRYRQMLAK